MEEYDEGLPQRPRKPKFEPPPETSPGSIEFWKNEIRREFPGAAAVEISPVGSSYRCEVWVGHQLHQALARRSFSLAATDMLQVLRKDRKDAQRQLRDGALPGYMLWLLKGERT